MNGREVCMKANPATSSRWATNLGGLLTVLIILIFLAYLVWHSTTFSVFAGSRGPAFSSASSALIRGALLLTIPLGLIDARCGQIMLTRLPRPRRLGIAYIAVGLIGTLFGLLFWWASALIC
jgi:hypothetical protein